MDFKNYYKHIIFDPDLKHLESLESKQGDTKTKGLYVQVVQNSQIISDISELTMRCYCLKPDNTEVYIEAIVDNEYFRVDFTNQVSAVSGTVKIELELRGADGESISNKIFYMSVNESLRNDAAIESTNEYTALETSLAKVDDWNNRIDVVEQDYIDRADAMEAQYPAELNSLESQLAEKATKTELEITNNNIDLKANEIEVRKNNVDITLADLSQEVKESMTGGSVAIVGNNTVGKTNIKTKVIDFDKTDFLNVISTNLFNKDDIVIGYYVSNSTGLLVESGTFGVTGYIPVIGGLAYKRDVGNTAAWYDKDYIFISGTSGISHDVAPVNAYYFRQSFPISTNLNNFKIWQQDIDDTTTIEYQPFLIKNKYEKNKVQSMELKTTGKNIVDLNNRSLAKSLGTKGEVTTNNSYNTTDFLMAEPIMTYVVLYAKYICEYDESLYFIKYTRLDITDPTVATVFTTNSKTKFIKVSYPIDYENLVQVEKGTMATEHEPIKYSLYANGKELIDLTSTVLSQEAIKGTTQNVNLNTDGSIDKIEYVDSLEVIERTDKFTYEENKITETRTLFDGKKMTLIHHLDTLQTEVI